MKYCSTWWCSAGDSQLKLLDRVTRSAGFLVGGVLECNLPNRRSVEVLCMLFKIRNNPMHPLSGALPSSYVPARIAHMHSFASPRGRTFQHRRTFVPLPVSLCMHGTILMTLCLMVRNCRCFPGGVISSFFLSPTAIFSISSLRGLVNCVVVGSAD